MRKTAVVWVVILLGVGIAIAPTHSVAAGKTAAVSQTAGNEGRVSGTIARSNPEKSTLVIKEHRSNIERTVFYSPSTQWTLDKKTVDMKEFKDGSQVVCIGKMNEKKELTASRCELQK